MQHSQYNTVSAWPFQWILMAINYRICHTATQPHTHTHTHHGEYFLALGFAYPLFYSLQSRPHDPTQLQDS